MSIEGHSVTIIGGSSWSLTDTPTYDGNAKDSRRRVGKPDDIASVALELTPPFGLLSTHRRISPESSSATAKLSLEVITNQKMLMKIAILGSGMVGNTLATKLVQLGLQVMMGSRTASTEAGQQWLRSVNGEGQIGTFSEAAAFGEIVFDCTNGANSLAALRQAGAANLRGKILIHVSNPLDFSKGMPPTLTVCSTDSLGEQVQREFPQVRVVKALNTVNCELMVQPSLVPGDHNLFICGNDAAAKRQVIDWLSEWFGWKRSNIIDLGDITGAHGMEMWMPIWLRLYGKIGHPHFNLRLIIADK